MYKKNKMKKASQNTKQYTKQIVQAFIALCLIMFLFAPLLASTPAHAAKEQFTAFQERTELDVCSCSTAQNTIFIENTGDVTSRFYTTKEGEGAKYTAFTDGRFILKPGEKHKITQFVTAPCKKEGTYELRTNLTSVFDNNMQLTTKINARACNNIDLRPNTYGHITTPCTPRIFESTLRNPSDFFEVYTFEVVQIEGPRTLTEQEINQMVTLSHRELLVPPKDTEKLSAIVTLPCKDYGNYAFSLKAKSKNSGFEVEVPFTLAINQQYHFSLSVAPSVQNIAVCKDMGNRIPVTLTNMVPVANTYDISTKLGEGKNQYYAPVYVPGKTSQQVNLFVEGNAPTGEQWLTIDGETHMGDTAQQTQVPVSVVYCDENGVPLPPEEWPQSNTTAWLLGLIALILLVLLVLGAVFFSKKESEPELPTKKEKKKLGPLLKEEKEEPYEDDNRPYIIGLIIIMLLLVALLAGAAYYYQIYLPAQDADLTEETTEGAEEEGISNWVWVLLGVIALLIILILILLIVMRVKGKEDKPKKKKEKTKKAVADKKPKKEKKSKAKEESNTWKWIFVILLALLLLAGLIVGTLYLTQGPPSVPEEIRSIYIDNTNLDGSNNMVYIGQDKEIVLVPLVIKNKGENPITIGLDFELPWLTISKALVNVLPDAEESVTFTVRPQQAEPGKYRFIFDIEDSSGDMRQEMIIIEIYDKWPSYKWYLLYLIIIGSLFLLLLIIFIIALLVSASRKKKGLLGPVKPAEAKKQVKAEKKPKKKEPKLPKEKKPFPKGLKKFLVYLLLFIILGSFIAGVYYLSTKYEIVVPEATTPVEEVQQPKVEAEANRLKVDVDGKTLLPVVLENINEETRYNITTPEQHIQVDPAKKTEVRVYIEPSKEEVTRVPIPKEEDEPGLSTATKAWTFAIVLLVFVLATIVLLIVQQVRGKKREALKEMARESKQSMEHKGKAKKRTGLRLR